jgi:hypothetical protein
MYTDIPSEVDGASFTKTHRRLNQIQEAIRKHAIKCEEQDGARAIRVAPSPKPR